MTRAHDMGGRFGDGPLQTEEAPAFEAEWHKRALALTLAAGGLGQWNIDMSRRAREQLAPKDYARFSYYEKWMGGLAALLVEEGLVSVEELASGRANGPSPRADKALRAEAVAPALAKGAPASRPSDVTPLFKPGDPVQTRPSGNMRVPGGHTRLPQYAARARGRILICHGAHVFPDSSAHGLGEAPEPLYAVCFAASELWPDAEAPGDEVVLDLWQSYLLLCDAP